ncbi:MAG: apolipoprotein N-acyltransferase [Alphaproteobacteria bacterium]|nr:apolipoprotein N-acyltransferase [Alphaproteobacteria bacterium]
MVGTLRDSLAVRAVVTLAACLLMSLEAPPTNLHWIQWVGLVPMFWVLRPDTPRSNRWLGYLYGVFGVAAIFRWLIDTIDLFSNLPFILAFAILLLFASVFGAPYALLWGSVHPMRRRLGTWWVVAWPALWVVLEYLCMKIFLFPYNHGVGQYQVPVVWQVVGITGVWGLTFLIFFGNAVLGEWFYRRVEGDAEPPGIAAAAFGACLLATVSYGVYRFEAVEQGLREARVVRLAQLQSGVTMIERLEMGSQRGAAEWIEWTKGIPRDTVDLIVWPEGAAPYLNVRGRNETEKRRGNRYRNIIGKLAKDAHAPIVVGAGTVLDTDDGIEVFNSVYAFDESGEVVGSYDKMVPLPFGEYFPFGEYVPWLANAIGGIGDFRAGTEPTLLAVAGTTIAAPICYEAILPDTCRSFDDPGLFVNVTNDAWFGDSAAPWQHGMLAASRTTELGVPMIRSTYSGISFVAEPHGVIHAETELFVPARRLVEVRLATFPTFYARFGDWFVGLCFLFVLALEARARLAPRETS